MASFCFICGCLVPLQAPKHRQIIGLRPVEQTAFRRDIKDNGYKSVFTNLWLERQLNRSWIRDYAKIQERVNSFIDGSAFCPGAPKKRLSVTRHPMFVTAMSGVLTRLPAKLSKNGMHVKTSADRVFENKIAGLNGLRSEAVN